MDIADYQRWVREFDVARGWDLTPPSEVFVHFMEEVGEIARCVLSLEGYRPLRDEAERAEWRAHLQEELADAITFLIKLAYQYDVDVANGLAGNQTKCDRRFKAESASPAVLAYLRLHKQEIERFVREYDERFPDVARQGREEES